MLLKRASLMGATRPQTPRCFSGISFSNLIHLATGQPHIWRSGYIHGCTDPRHDIENCCSYLYICLWIFKYTKITAVFFIILALYHSKCRMNLKFVQNEKYSAKDGDLLRFLLYLCHVIDDFACLDLQH